MTFNPRSPVYEFFLRRPIRWYTPKQVAAALDRTVPSVYPSLGNLTAKGLLIKHKAGDYKMAPVEYKLATNDREKAKEDYRVYVMKRQKSYYEKQEAKG